MLLLVPGVAGLTMIAREPRSRPFAPAKFATRLNPVGGSMPPFTMRCVDDDGDKALAFKTYSSAIA